MIENKKILITGGAGFIGTSLAERLVENNRILLGDINFNRNSIKFTRLVEHPNVKLVELDVLDMQSVKNAVKEADIVVHTAAVLGVVNVIRNPIKTLEVNFIGTSNLLKASHEYGIEKFMYFSTSEIFGMNSYRTSEDGSMAISSVQDARWCYSLSKLAGEHLVWGYYKLNKLPIVIIRPFNVFGPGRIGDYAILRFALRALKGVDLYVYGDGSQIRAWCYIDDFVEALVKALEIEDAVGHAFNIGNPLNTITIYQLAKLVIKLTNSPSRIQLRNAEFSDIDVRVPNIEKAKAILKYSPRVDIEIGLQKTIDWYRKYLHEIENMIGKSVDAIGVEVLP